MTWLKKHLPVAGYVVLALATAGTFAREAQHNAKQRADLARQTTTVLQNGCARGNVLRTTLQRIILQGIPQVEQYIKDGTLTREQGDRAIAQARTNARLVGPLNCATRKVG